MNIILAFYITYTFISLFCPSYTGRFIHLFCDKGVAIFFFFNCIYFTSYFMFSIAVLPHSPGVVYYHLLLRRETRIPGVAPFSFRIGIWDLFVHRRQKSYTPTAFGKLWTTPGVRCLTCLIVSHIIAHFSREVTVIAMVLSYMKNRKGKTHVQSVTFQ